MITELGTLGDGDAASEFALPNGARAYRIEFDESSWPEEGAVFNAQISLSTDGGATWRPDAGFEQHKSQAPGSHFSADLPEIPNRRLRVDVAKQQEFTLAATVSVADSLDEFRR